MTNLSEGIRTSRACPACERSGSVRVTPFHEDGAAQLRWYCPECQHTWVERERRAKDRSDPAPSS